MKSKKVISLIIGSLLLLGTSQAAGDEVVMSHAERAAALTAQYMPQFDAQYARLMIVREKIAADPILMRSMKAMLLDFDEVRRVIEYNLASATSELDGIGPYAEEELGEFAPQISQFESDAAKIRTITCVKGKTLKKVTGLTPKCPKGYTKKK